MDCTGNYGEIGYCFEASVPSSWHPHVHWVGVCWNGTCLCLHRLGEEMRKSMKLVLKCSDVLCQVSIHVTFCSQVSSSASPQASLESHVFNVAVLPQTPRAPQLSLGSSLHMAVSVKHHWLLVSVFLLQCSVTKASHWAVTTKCWFLCLL